MDNYEIKDNYVLMCMTLPELQEQWKPNEYDKIFNKITHQYNVKHKKHIKEIEHLGFCQTCYPKEKTKEWAVYIPSFEDLIQMIQEHFGTTSDLLPYYFKAGGKRDEGDIWDKECVLNFLAETKWGREWNWMENKWEVAKCGQ